MDLQDPTNPYDQALKWARYKLVKTIVIYRQSLAEIEVGASSSRAFPPPLPFLL